MIMQVKVPKKYYQILKQALLESYHHEVCHFDDLECTIERKFPVRELLSEESNKRINKWSWGIVLEFLRRIEEKNGRWERRASQPSITRVIDQKLSGQYENCNYFALCEYVQRIWTVAPTEIGVGASTPSDDFVGEGIFYWSDEEGRFILWDEDAPTWEEIEGIFYEVLEILNDYQPLVKYLDYCIKNDEGETSIYNNPGLIMPVGYENVTEDGCEFLIVKKL
jgi:hypothetical protein